MAMATGDFQRIKVDDAAMMTRKRGPLTHLPDGNLVQGTKLNTDLNKTCKKIVRALLGILQSISGKVW